MTTPHQGAPDGAVTVGGGAWRYGQLVSEKTHRASFDITPPTNLAEALELLPAVMSQLPNDAMKPWQAFFNMTDAQRANGEVLQQFLDSLQDSPLTKVIADTQDTIDGMIRGLVGWIETGYTPAQVEQAAKDLSVAVSDLRTIITALKASTGYAGVARVVDFTSSDNASSLGSNWDQSYSGTGGSGTFGVSGGRAKWLGSADHRSFWARYTEAHTKSDYQKIGATFGTSPSLGLFGLTRSKNRIYGRVSTDGSNHVVVEFNADSWLLGCSNGWAWTTFASSSFASFTFKPGAVYWLECGTTGGPRIFRVWENNRILCTYTDSSAHSVLGSEQSTPDDYRWVALGGEAFSGDYRPAEIGSFAFYDSTPVPMQGCGWRISRTSTSTANQSSGDNTFPSSWFDTIDYATDDLSYDSTNNKITVPATGWYQINVVSGCSNTIVGGGVAAPTLIVNGSVAQQGSPNPQTGGINAGFGGSFVVYLHEGDNVKPGYWSSWSATSQLAGEATGTKVYWSGSFLGTNKKPVS